MSFFTKLFASIGIGSARVDTKLERDKYRPGDEVKGVVEVKGGAVAQNIEEIYISLHTKYIVESDSKEGMKTATIERIRINDPFTILVDEIKEIPFSFTLPLDTPLTYGKVKVWIATSMDIKNAVDPRDEDFIDVVPTPLIHATFLELTHLGFKLREAECEEAPYILRKRVPFLQEFEFVPISGPFCGKLDEVEFTFFQSTLDEATILLEIDRRSRGLTGLFSEILELDETKVQLHLNSRDIPHLEKILYDVIAKYVS